MMITLEQVICPHQKRSFCLYDSSLNLFYSILAESLHTIMNKNTQTPNPPIYIVGAGGIVKDAHLPAYAIAGFEIAGITDLDAERAQAVASEFNIQAVYADLGEMLKSAPADAIFDVAIPAHATNTVLKLLPDNSSVLIQKPMGETLEQADEILATCRSKNLTAAVNVQLRFAPFIQMAREAIAEGKIGELTDIEVRLNVETPWHLWDFLEKARSAEIYYHSIHYVDMIRSIVGNPTSVQCKLVNTHTCPKVDGTRSSYILDYGSDLRVNIQTNHGHRFGKRHQESYVKFEGTQGAIKLQMGLLMNYPEGEPDWFEICQLEDGREPEWKSLPIEGSWFPHAFIGSMQALMDSVKNPEITLAHSVEDVHHTMRVLDRAEQSTLSGGVAIN